MESGQSWNLEAPLFFGGPLWSNTQGEGGWGGGSGWKKKITDGGRKGTGRGTTTAQEGLTQQRLMGGQPLESCRLCEEGLAGPLVGLSSSLRGGCFPGMRRAWTEAALRAGSRE